MKIALVAQHSTPVPGNSDKTTAAADQLLPVYASVAEATAE